MEKRQIPTRLYYCAEKTLTAPEISGFAEEVMEKICSTLKAAGIAVTGPPEFHYFNVDPTGKNPFQLIIAIPVTEQKKADSSEPFFFLQSELFTCITEDYSGPMAGINEAWMNLAVKVMGEGYLLQNQGREVYKKWISFDSPENVTELQIGIAAKKS
jgi:effector-binding domain-containing protein